MNEWVGKFMESDRRRDLKIVSYAGKQATFLSLITVGNG